MAFDFAAQQAALARRRQLADMLYKQSATGLNVPAGSRASPFDALGDIALAWSAKSNRDAADADEKKLSADQTAAFDEMLSTIPQGRAAQPAVPGGEAESAEGGGQTPGLPAQPAQPPSLKEMLAWGGAMGKTGPWGEKVGAEVIDQVLKNQLPNQVLRSGGAGAVNKNDPVLTQRYHMALANMQDQFPDMDPVQQQVHARRVALNDISVTPEGSPVVKSLASVGGLPMPPTTRQGAPAPAMIPKQGMPPVPGAAGPAGPPPMVPQMPRSTDEMPPARPPAAAPAPTASPAPDGAVTAPLAPPPDLNERPDPTLAPQTAPSAAPSAAPQLRPNGQPYPAPAGGPVFAALTEKLRAEQPARDADRMKILLGELTAAQQMPAGPERDKQIADLTQEVRQTDQAIRNGFTPKPETSVRMAAPAQPPVAAAPPPMIPTAGAAPAGPPPMLAKAPGPNNLPAGAPRPLAFKPEEGEDNPYLPRPANSWRGELPRKKDPEPEIQAYGKRLNDDEIPALGQAFAQLDSVFQKLSVDPNTGLTMSADGQPGGNVPGYGGPMGIFNISKVKLTPEGRAIQVAYAPLSNIILNARSGKAVTDGEMKRHLLEVGQAFGQSDEEFWQAYANLKNYVGAKKATIDQSFHPYIREQFAKRGAVPAQKAGNNKGLPPGFKVLGGS